MTSPLQRMWWPLIQLVEDTAMNLQETRLWCTQAHGKQMYGPYPYSHHLRAAENVAIRFGHRSISIRKGIWLHDVPEDCNLSVSMLLLAGHDQRSVMMADAVTDGEGTTREEKKAGTFEKIRTTPGAKIVKLCDRIANAEFSSSKLGDPAKFATYRDEYPEFQRQLRDRTELHLEPMWRHLDSLFSSAAAVTQVRDRARRNSPIPVITKVSGYASFARLN